MDHGILEAFKLRYKKQLLRHVTLENESSTLTVPQIVKKLTIKDAIYRSAQAWKEATLLNLSKTWNKLILPEPQTTQDCSNEEGRS